jgi:hypothetical protein
MNKTRMVVIADLHSGHEYGLTPPAWWQKGDADNERVRKVCRFQRVLWKFYEQAIESLKPIDVLVVNGDAIEGKGELTGGIELITSDRHEQVRMAKAAIDFTEAKKIRLIYGSKYHVGKSEDFESALRDTLKCSDTEAHGHGFFAINGCKIDVKHKVAGSAIPHGRHTAIARARLWNVIWNAEHERQPRADILIRSHTHAYNYCGGESWLGVITPALTYNSSYGIRSMEGLVDVGLLYFDIDEAGRYRWGPIMANFRDLKVLPESL